MGFDLESREAVSYFSCRLSEVASRTSACQSVEDTSEHAHRYLSGSCFLFGGDISDVVDEDVGVTEQFLSGIGERVQASRGLQRQFDIDIVSVILSALLYQTGVECGVRDGVAFEPEPLGYHLLAYLRLIEQSLGMTGVRLQLGCGQLVAVGGFEIAGVATLHTAYLRIVDYACAGDTMVIILIGHRERVESLVYLVAELILRVIDEHRSKRVAAVVHITLCLCGKNRTSTEQC